MEWLVEYTLPSETKPISMAARLPVWSRRLAFVVIALGSIALLGWIANIESLKSVLPGLTTMKVNTALTLIFLGIAVTFLNRSSPASQLIVLGCVFATYFMGLSAASEYLFHVDLHVDNLLIQDRALAVFPGRMAPTTMVCLLIDATALLLLELGRSAYVAQVLLAVTVVVSLATLGGYLYGAPQMLAHAPYPVVALNTALALVLLAIGGLFARPNVGAMRTMVADTTGGWLARRLIPTAIAVPTLVGLCVVIGQRAGVYGAAFSVALTVSSDVAVMTAVVWSVSSMLSRSDALRQENERAAALNASKFKALSNAMPQMVWTAQPNGAIDYYNDRWYEFTGLPKDQINDQSWGMILHPEDLERSRDVYWDAIRTGLPYQIEYRFKDIQAGGYRWFLGRALPIRDEGGFIQRWYGTCTDIDEQKRAIEERRVALEAERIARAEAERHSQLKDNFLATLSHELRTPLMAILGWAVLLTKRSDLDSDMQQGLEVIERNARGQARIIEDLLDMSRIISGKLRLEVQRVDLLKVIEEAVQTARAGAEAKELQLSIMVDESVPTIMGDPNRIQQIAWNLLSNAIKFTPRGGWVRVSVARNDSQVQLTIEDNGQGIEEDFVPYLFERFRQADSGITRRHGGLGLGLSIVRQLVELHGGSVRAQSRGEGQGSTFSVSFPVAATSGNAVVEEKRLQSTSNNGQSAVSIDDKKAVRGLRILAVDDEADARSLIRRVLEECEAIVVTAVSAEDALAKLDLEQFDVLVCDIGMPEQDGYELIRTIRQREPIAGGDIPAAALTAFARTEERARALKSGFQVHAAKPVEPAELIATVAFLARRRARI